MTRTTQDAPSDGPSVTADTITCEQWDPMRRWRRTPPGFDRTRINHLANIAENSTAWPANVVAHAREDLAAAWNSRHARTGATP